MKRAAIYASLLFSLPALADYQMVLTIKEGDDIAFRAVDKPWEYERQCLMVLRQYQRGAAQNALSTEMVGGSCLDCDEFPEFCSEGI